MLPADVRARYLAEAGPPKPAPQLPELPEIPDELAVTRSLLDQLATYAATFNPPYDERAPLSRFLGQSAFTASGFHLRSVSALLHEQICGLVAVAIARAMLEDALTWAWIAEDRTSRETCLGRHATDELNGLEARISQLTGSRRTYLDRWCPADTGELSAAQAESSAPSTVELIEQIATGALGGPAAELLRFGGLRTAAAVLAIGGHFNRYSALWTPVPLKVSPNRGFDDGGRLVPAVEALVAHVAAVSFASVALASAGLHPGDESPAFAVDDIIQRAVAVSGSAATAHLLGASHAPVPVAVRRAVHLARTGTVFHPRRRRPNVDLAPIRDAAEQLLDLIHLAGPRPVAIPPISRVRCVVLPMYLSAAWAFRTAAHRDNVTAVAAFGARQLVEEAARWEWALNGSDEDTQLGRANGLWRDLVHSRRRIERAITKDGLGAVACRPFTRPGGFDVADLAVGSGHGDLVPDAVTTALEAIRPAADGEPRAWLAPAYSLLSQITHHTPVGVMHAQARDGDDISSGALTPIMESLVVDCAATGAAVLFRHLGVLLIGSTISDSEERFDPDRYRTWVASLEATAGEIHQLAAPIHGLFGRGFRGAATDRNAPCVCGVAKVKHCHPSALR